jgi:sugar lactone lactonase YvrE
MQMKKNFIYSLFLFLYMHSAYAQNIGIGTTTPNNKLEVNSGGKERSGLRLTQLADTNNAAQIYSRLINTEMLFPLGMAEDTNGNFYVSARNENKIYKINSNGTKTLYHSLGLLDPQYMTFDDNGNLFVVQNAKTEILKITPAGAVSVFCTLNGADNAGEIYSFHNNLFVLNYSSSQIMKINSAGVKSIFNTGTFTNPEAFALNKKNGNMYVFDHTTQAIFLLDSNGVGGIFSLLSSYGITYASAMTVDKDNNLLVLTNNIYKIDPNGILSTYMLSPGFLGNLMQTSAGTTYGIQSVDNKLFKLENFSNKTLSVNKTGDVVVNDNYTKLVNGQIHHTEPTYYDASLIAKKEFISLDASIAKLNCDTMRIAGPNIFDNYYNNEYSQFGLLNGTKFKTILCGNVQIGSSQVRQTYGYVTFPSLMSKPYRVIASVHQDGIYTDVFAVSTTIHTNAGFVANVYRIDGTSWGQNLSVDYIVIEIE